MKKVLAILLVAVMVIGMLAMSGCRKKGGNNAFDADKTITPDMFDFDEQVTITFKHTMGANLQGVLNTYIEEFNKIYPNITIEHTSAGGWADINGQINTEIAGGTQPNIAYCYPDHVAMYNIAQSVITLDEFINSTGVIEETGETIGLTDAQKADFIESYYNEGLAYGDGKMYTMPLSKSTEVLYYNKTFFDANGLSVPTTWDELWEVCDQILKIDPKCIPLGYDAEDNWFITLCEQMGTGYTSAEDGGKYLFDNAENQAMVLELRDKFQAGYYTTQEIYASYTSSLFTNQDPDTSRSYMCIGSSGGASYQMSNSDTSDGTFAFEVGVASIPQYDQNNKKVISQGPSLCILNGPEVSDQQAIASWLFVKFLCTNVDFQAEFSMTSGYMPVLKSVTENEVYAGWLNTANGYENLVATCVKVGIEGRDNYFISPAFDGSSTARTQVGSLLVKCISTSTDDPKGLIDQAFKEAIQECEY